MVKLENKIVIRHSGRNKFNVKTFNGDSSTVIEDEVVEYPSESLEQVAEELGVKEVDLVEDPNTGEEYLEIPAGTEVSDEIIDNCNTKRNAKSSGKITIKRMSRSRFLVRNSDGTEETVVDPTLDDLTLDEIAEQLPVTSADIVEDNDGSEFIEIDSDDVIDDDDDYEDDMDDMENPIIQNSRRSINSRYRRNSAPTYRRRSIQKRRTIRNW